MNGPAVSCLGWTATAMFVASYFFVGPRALRAPAQPSLETRR